MQHAPGLDGRRGSLCAEARSISLYLTESRKLTVKTGLAVRLLGSLRTRTSALHTAEQPGLRRACGRFKPVHTVQSVRRTLDTP